MCIKDRAILRIKAEDSVCDTKPTPFFCWTLLYHFPFQTIPRSSPCYHPYSLHLLHTSRRKNHNIPQRNAQPLTRDSVPLSPAFVKHQLGIRSRQDSMRATLRLTMGMEDLPRRDGRMSMIGTVVLLRNKNSRGPAFDFGWARFKRLRIRVDDMRYHYLKSLQFVRDPVQTDFSAMVPKSLQQTDVPS